MLNIFLGLILLVALSAERIRTVRRRKPAETPPDTPSEQDAIPSGASA